MSESQKDPLEVNPSEELENADKPAEQAAPAEQPAVSDEAATEDNHDEAAQPAEAVVQPARQPMKAWPWMVVSVIAIVALIVVLVRESSGNKMNAAVGELDGKKVTQAELYDELQKTMGDQQLGSTLDNLMTMKLISIEADKTGKKVSDADVDATVKKLEKQYGFATDADFESALSSSGMTLESYKEQQVLPQLELRLIFEQKAEPTDAQLQDYYNKNKDKFATTPEQVTASQIVTKTKEEAQAVLQQLKQGADFATLAKEKSIDTTTKDNGGSLGTFGKGQLGDDTVETAAFALKKDELSDVIQSSVGYVVLKVTGHTTPVIPSYDEAKADVKATYLDEQISTGATDWIAQAKKDLGYKNYLTKEDATTPEASPSASPAASAPAEPSASASASTNK